MSKSNLAWIALIVLIVAVLFMIFKPNQSSNSVAPSNIKTFNLVVKNNKLVSGPDTLSVNERDQVTIKITADTDGEFHLHGYNKHIEFKKDTPAELTFKADTSGRFPYELEDTKTEIGALEVLPK